MTKPPAKLIESNNKDIPSPWWQSKLAKNTGIFFVVALLAGLVIWFFAFRPYVSTDDARVAEDLIRIAPDGVSGTVMKINVAEGDPVTQGQVLAELDHTTYQSQLDKAQAHAMLAQSDLKRSQNLYQQAALTARNYQSAQATAQDTQADLQLAQNALDHTYLKSPVEGIVVEKIAVAGNINGSGPGGAWWWRISTMPGYPPIFRKPAWELWKWASRFKSKWTRADG